MNTFTKAGTLLSKGSPSDAVYVNNCLDEIIKQLTVNRQHIDLFYAVYTKLLDRLFGEDVCRAIENLNANPSWIKGSPGGWLRALMTLSLTNTEDGSGNRTNPLNTLITSQSTHPMGRGVNAQYLDSLPYPISHILQKLAPFSPMLEILTKIQVGYEVKLSLLPLKLQMLITDHPVFGAVGSKSSARMCHQLLQNTLLTVVQVPLSFFRSCVCTHRMFPN
jgi:hypothetical protein